MVRRAYGVEVACSTDRLSLMVGTHGRVRPCPSTLGTGKVVLNSSGEVCSSSRNERHLVASVKNVFATVRVQEVSHFLLRVQISKPDERNMRGGYHAPEMEPWVCPNFS